jgi:predicted DNA-binding transcriptional regulator
VRSNRLYDLYSEGSEFEMDKTQEVIFESIVRIAWNWESEGVASVGHIAKRTELSKYMVRKHIKIFMEQGFLESEIRSGGFDEFACKPYPPLKGYKLTDKAKQIELYKVTKEDEDRQFGKAFCGW